MCLGSVEASYAFYSSRWQYRLLMARHVNSFRISSTWLNDSKEKRFSFLVSKLSVSSEKTRKQSSFDSRSSTLWDVLVPSFLLPPWRSRKTLEVKRVPELQRTRRKNGCRDIKWDVLKQVGDEKKRGKKYRGMRSTPLRGLHAWPWTQLPRHPVQGCEPRKATTRDGKYEESSRTRKREIGNVRLARGFGRGGCREGEKEKRSEVRLSAVVERVYGLWDQYSRVLRSFILPRPSALSSTHAVVLSFSLHISPSLSLSFSLSVSSHTHPLSRFVSIPPTYVSISKSVVILSSKFLTTFSMVGDFCEFISLLIVLSRPSCIIMDFRWCSFEYGAFQIIWIVLIAK